MREFDPSGRELFDLLRRYRLAAPEQRSGLAAAVLSRFGAERTILVGDMAGFTRRVLDEGIVHYLSLIAEMRAVCAPLVAAGGGELHKTEADNLLCSFAAPEPALETACHIQRRLRELNERVAGPDRIELGLGLASGPVLAVGTDDVWGSAVNLASKLGEDLSRAGEILAHESLLAALDRLGLEAEERAVEQSRVRLRYFSVQWH